MLQQAVVPLQQVLATHNSSPSPFCDAQVRTLDKLLQAAHKGGFFLDSKVVSLSEDEDRHSAECLLIVAGALAPDVLTAAGLTWTWKELFAGCEVCSLQPLLEC